MIETLILGTLIHNEEYSRKVIPFLKDEYFDSVETKLTFECIEYFIQKYNKIPTKDVLYLSLDDNKTLNQEQYKIAKTFVSSLEYNKDNDMDWLLDKTEQFCKDKALFNAIRSSIQIMDDDNSKLTKDAIPQIVQDALAVSFDSHIGHDYFEDVSKRFDFYHEEEEHTPFDINLLNTITKGGFVRKTLNILMAGTGGGKSLAMCHFAATNLMHGKNVLYITLEMSEEKISERIDMNLIDISVDELARLPRETFERRVAKIKSKTNGKLIVKEYPTASAGSSHFRHLIHELRLKKNFIPDIIYIDYLNICCSARFKSGTDSYTYVKAIAEELRGLGVEFNVPIVSATQVNRSGFNSSDMDLGDTSESFGLPATADLFLALITTEELDDLGQIMIKQLKNRYNDVNFHKKFVVGIDRARMRLYEVENSAQDDVDKPVMNNTDFGERQEEDDNQFKQKFNKNKIWDGFA